MSISEATAIEAVQDGLDGRNVPIVHDEIRVVLAMALERDALRARAETAERQRDGLAQTISISARETATLALRVAELARERDAATACLAGREKYLGERIQTLLGVIEVVGQGAHTLRVAEMEREAEGMRQRARAAEAQRDEAVSRAQESLTESVRAKADAARLREAMERLIEDVACLPVDFCDEDEEREAEEVLVRARATLASAPSAEPEGPDYSGLCSAPECGGHCGYTHAVGCEAIREYLAEHGGAPYKAPARTAHLAPSAEPTPRDMRVAEAVGDLAARIVQTRNVENWTPDELANEIRSMNLAAVVAKAVRT